MINYALSVHLNQPLYLLFVQVLIFTNTGVMVPLPWFTRMKIALGAAKGLAFLHEAEKPVIYRDFKTSNILLDEVDGVFFFILTVMSYLICLTLKFLATCKENLHLFRFCCLNVLIQESSCQLNLMIMGHKLELEIFL